MFNEKIKKVSESGRDRVRGIETQRERDISNFQWLIGESMLVNSTGRASAWDTEPLEPPTGRTYSVSIFEPSNLTVIQLSNELRALLKEVLELRSELRSRPLTSSILLSNLNNEELSIQNPISIILEESDEECLARWPEVNAYGLGSTLHEAILDLKQNIVNLFWDVSNRDEESLGELAIETYNTLKAYIKEEE